MQSEATYDKNTALVPDQDMFLVPIPRTFCHFCFCVHALHGLSVGQPHAIYTFVKIHILVYKS